MSSSNFSTSASLLKETSTTSIKKDKNNPKFIKLLADWHKKNVKAIALFVCNIDSDLLDEIHVDDIAKAIWNYFQNQFGKKGFTLQYTLFIHLMTFKLSAFNILQDFQIDFKLTLSKLYKSSKSFSKDLQIVAFLYRVKKLIINRHLQNGLSYRAKELIILYL